jgi:hypothetical protein
MRAAAGKSEKKRRSDARQTTGLALSTTRRVRYRMRASEWSSLSGGSRVRCYRPCLGVALRWTFENDGADGMISSPVSRLAEPMVTKALKALADVQVVDALTFAHLAVVRYVDGSQVVMGCEDPPESAEVVQVQGYPLARLSGQRVVSWQGRCHGHTDDEMRAARRFDHGGQRVEEQRR